MLQANLQTKSLFLQTGVESCTLDLFLNFLWQLVAGLAGDEILFYFFLNHFAKFSLFENEARSSSDETFYLKQRSRPMYFYLSWRSWRKRRRK